MATALITGASAGIGAAFARELAARRYNLVLIARSQDKLQELATSLKTQYPIQVDIIVQDLTEPNAGETVFEKVQQQGTVIDLLINNAGMGDYGDFAECDRDFQLKMIQLNIAALVDLTHRFLQPMRQRRSGSIINLASVAAFQTMPYFSIYSATKAFILSFSEAIWAENQKYNVHILAVCPGPVGKDFFQQTGFPTLLVEAVPLVDTPVATVVRDALAALQKQQSIVIPGNPANHVLAAIPRVLPHPAIATLWRTILGFGRG
jgi:uncharacterized protein